MNKPEDEPRGNVERDARFAQQLTRALAHTDPPADFEQRVLAAAAAGTARPAPAPRLPPPRPWYALAAILLLAALAFVAGALQREQQRRVTAGRQFDQAIAITGHALDHTRVQLERAGIHLHP